MNHEHKKTKTYRHQHAFLGSLVGWMGVLLGVVVFVYLYGVMSTTMLMAQKRSFESQGKKLASDIALQEISYLELSEIMNDGRMQEFGFQPAERITFIARNGNTQNFAYARQ